MAEITRQQIAAALSGVTVSWAGEPQPLSGSAEQPASLAVWQAWVDWQSASWRGRCVIERTWNVYVILPAADAPAWSAGLDAVLEPVRDALIQLGQVPRAEPVALVAGDRSSTMPAVNFTLITS